MSERLILPKYQLEEGDGEEEREGGRESRRGGKERKGRERVGGREKIWAAKQQPPNVLVGGLHTCTL